ncbi:MAG: GTP 3',8-cyclase MoaA [Acidobacteriota bacterium]
MALYDQLDRPLRDLRVSVTDRCNLRCHYCMPVEVFGPDYPFLERGELLSYEEIARLGRIFVSCGVEKIRITGGEPLVRRGLPGLIEMLSRIRGVRDLTLTTNGLLLKRQAKDLKAAGLQRITVSLDSIDEEVFRRMNGLGVDAADVLAGIEAAQEAGLVPVKINTVVQRGVNDHTLVDLARHFRGTDCIVRFIEYMDVGNTNGWRLEEVVSAQEILARIHTAFPLQPVPPQYRGEVANRWRYLDGQGEIGVISSVTVPFCGHCSRARLSSEGRLYTCLFAERGFDLRNLLRGGASDEDLRNTIRSVWTHRGDRYSEIRSLAGENRSKVEMSHIGG